MSNVVDTFNNRVSEVEIYFDLLTAVDRPGATIRGADGSSTTVHVDWLPIMKASAFLVLYNLVESSMRESMAVLYARILAENKCASDLHQLIRDIWIEQAFRRLNPGTASMINYRDEAKKLVRQALQDAIVELDAHFLPVSGNLDADKVREICTNHGISVTTIRGAEGGWRLETVKSSRNALAHGDLSFAECGRQYTLADLIQVKRQVVLFMRSIISNVQEFMTNTRYCA